jgi:hypothetical protein
MCVLLHRAFQYQIGVTGAQESRSKCLLWLSPDHSMDTYGDLTVGIHRMLKYPSRLPSSGCHPLAPAFLTDTLVHSRTTELTHTLRTRPKWPLLHSTMQVAPLLWPSHGAYTVIADFHRTFLPVGDSQESPTEALVRVLPASRQMVVTREGSPTPNGLLVSWGDQRCPNGPLGHPYNCFAPVSVRYESGGVKHVPGER